ncbi:MAG TPA: oligoribonuclease [Acidimicrobiia bacterium]|jgi:oligoribonuclease
MADAPAPAADDRLVWLDLEMTGLVVESDVIVELAVLVTDAALEPLDDGLDVVVHQPPEVLDRMGDFVRAMHTRSGLLPEIETSTVTLDEAGARALEYVKGHVPTAGSAPMCGNTIGMDRRFLDRYLPDLDNYIHYRSIDVSTLKELCRRWYPETYRKRPGKAEKHRALDDVRESIAELRFYRETILRDLPQPS